MSVKDDLTRLCQIEASLSALSAQRDTIRRRLLDHALNTLEQEGVAPTWRAGDMGSVSLTMPKSKAEVFDEDAFAAWVEESYGPGTVETVTRVMPNVRTAVLEAARDGEEPDGVSFKTRLPFLQVRLSKEAKLAAAAELETESA